MHEQIWFPQVKNCFILVGILLCYEEGIITLLTIVIFWINIIGTRITIFGPNFLLLDRTHLGFKRRKERIRSCCFEISSCTIKSWERLTQVPGQFVMEGFSVVLMIGSSFILMYDFIVHVST
uniref:Uncharacterized protein n=1 Tax=Cacopsylla melanoneura TaxID=428564 RepID=A0A8D9BGQ5_9HEMI